MNARFHLNIVLAIFVVCSSIFAQSNPQTNPTVQESEDSWIHPAEAAYRTAMQEGFDGKAKIGNYNEDKDGIHQVWLEFKTSRGENNVIMFFSPLRCAQLLGINARQKLLDIPAVSDARKICDGNLYVSVTYSSRVQAASFPLVIEHDGTGVRPATVDFTEDPDVRVYRSGSYFTEYSYTYLGNFFFKMPSPWTDNVSLSYVVPENGNPTKVSVDFSAFAKDEAAYRLGIRD